MKNLLLLTLFITFILQGCEDELVYNEEAPYIERAGEEWMSYKGTIYNGKYIRYWDDGTLSKVMEKGSYLDDKREGVWEWYYENGQLNRKGSYIYGKMDGFWEEYYENGQLNWKGSYKNEKPVDGIYTEYHQNGQLKCKGSYLNGKRDDVWEFYYENGKLEEKGSFLNGNLNGVWEYYNEDGSLKYTLTHDLTD